MKIIYTFDDGSTSEVEVDEELGMFISAEEKKEQNEQRKQRYRFLSLDVLLDAGVEPGENFTMLDYEYEEHEKFIYEFLETLNENQKKRLLIKIENPDITYREMARQEGVSKNAITDTFIYIRKKYEKFIKKHLPK